MKKKTLWNNLPQSIMEPMMSFGGSRNAGKDHDSKKDQ